MRLTHFGHAAVLVETDAGKKVLLDPGTYADGFEAVTDLDVILVTHGHPDHIDAERLGALRAANPRAVLVSNADAAAAAGSGQRGDLVVVGNEVIESAGVRIEPTGALHATVYPPLPPVANTGFVIDGGVWHPGDAFDGEPRSVDILLLPVGGPWMRVADAIDFAKAVAPRIVVPIHQAGLADVHRRLHYSLLRNFAPDSEVVVLDEGVAQEF